MCNHIKIPAIILFITFILISPVFSDDSVTITTYYPSPYGSYNELTTASNTYLATEGGNVGIGTAEPSAKLFVSGQSNNTFTVGGTTYAPAAMQLSASGAHGFVTQTDNSGYWAFLGKNTASNNEILFGGPDVVDFRAVAGTSGTFIIKSTGNVGIGTASPETKLHVQGPAFFRPGSSGQIAISTPTGLNGISITTNDANQYRADIRRASYGIDFATHNASGAPPVRMTVYNDGNVGIGTASPSEKLDVAGYVKGQTGFCIGNDCRTNWILSGTTPTYTVNGNTIRRERINFGKTFPVPPNVVVSTAYHSSANPIPGGVWLDGVDTTGFWLKMYGNATNPSDMRFSWIAVVNQ